MRRVFLFLPLVRIAIRAGSLLRIFAFSSAPAVGQRPISAAVRPQPMHHRRRRSVPYISIDGSGGVVVGPGGEPLPGVPTTSGKRSGIGDLSLGASYTVPSETLGGLELALGGRVKLPTSSKEEQLSTGETDLTLSADASYAFGNVVPFVNVGYRWLGDPEGFNLRNGPTASIGSSFILGRSVLITSYDYARASSALTDDSHELFAGLSAPLSSSLTLTGYGIAGLSEGSPDVGAGLLITAKLF